MHTSVTTYHRGYVDVAKKLAKSLPAIGFHFLCNSGAEAVEGACYPGRPGIINFRGSFTVDDDWPWRSRHPNSITAKNTSRYRLRSYGSFPYVYRSHFRDNEQACVDEVSSTSI